MALRDQFIRRWLILRALEDGGLRSIEELLDLLAAAPDAKSGHRWSYRTLRRDLSYLIQAGFPLEGMRKGRKMRYRLSEGFLASSLEPFSPSEWAVLYFALSVLRNTPGSPLREPPLVGCMGGLFAKLRKFVPDTLQAYAEEIEPRYAGVIGALREQSRIRQVGEALEKAIAAGRPARILAAPPGEVRRRWFRVDPYLLRYHSGGYHLLGRDAASGSLEVWPVRGIDGVRPAGGAAQLPLGLELEALLAERLRASRGREPEARVRFRAGAAGGEIAAFLEAAFEPARIFRKGRRGPVEVGVRTGDLGAFRRWMLAFGADAEVVSPKELRHEVIQDLENALKKYQKGVRRPKRS